jgi:hypothetical protein
MSNYLIEGGRVAYFDDYYFRKPLPMPQADAASFEPVDRWFARDRNHVYFLYNIVEEAAPASFTVLGGYNDFWAKDAGQAWYFCPSKAAKQFWPLAGVDLARFALVERAPFVKYAGDGQVIWYRGKQIRGAEAASFRILPSDRMGEAADAVSYHFARDRRRIYFEGQPIKDADPQSFVVIHQPGLGHDEYGVDAGGAYRQSRATGRVEPIGHDRLPAPVREHFEALRARGA